MLPKSRDIRMSVTQFYVIANIEYISSYSFDLFVERPDLVPVVSYPSVFNPKDKLTTTLVLDANNSVDP